jgi:oligopeptide/dipeptide ABC transporter ATP-binding protein
MTALLDISGLSVSYATDHGMVEALRHANLEANAGEVVGIVGESGSGKSTLIAAIANLLPGNAQVTEGTIRYKGADIIHLDRDAQRGLRGREIAMVFQDPMTAFNPVLTIGDQLIDFQHQARGPSRQEKRRRASEMLARVGIPDAELRLASFPHELSGGTRQRIAIAAALLMEPSLLIADEPTTALDVTMESQIIHLLRELKSGYNGSIIIVTHHLGVIAELCDRVYVMYAGEIVERGLIDDIFHSPLHPYTRALLDCDPARFHEREEILPTIPGELPNLARVPSGCVFAPRCKEAISICRLPPPAVAQARDHVAYCHLVQP